MLLGANALRDKAVAALTVVTKLPVPVPPSVPPPVAAVPEEATKISVLGIATPACDKNDVSELPNPCICPLTLYVIKYVPLDGNVKFIKVTVVPAGILVVGGPTTTPETGGKSSSRNRYNISCCIYS